MASKRGVRNADVPARPPRAPQGPLAADAGSASDEPGRCTEFQLSVFFDGLCVFVPGLNRDVMRVLMVNSCGGHSGGGHTSAAVPAHVPYIQAKQGDLRDARDWDVLLRSSPEVELQGEPSAVRFLSWHDVLIPPEQPQQLTIAGGRIPGSQEPDVQPGHHSLNDFSWVPELDRAASGGGEVDPRCFDPDPPRELVIGRMRLLVGKIQVDDVVRRSGDGASVIWEFKGSSSGKSSGYSQALAGRIRYLTTIHDDHVTLRLKPFRIGGKAVDLVLAPRNPAEPVVNVKIGNLPLDEIVALQLEDYPAIGSDAHFPMLYHLSPHRPDDPPVPSPISHPPGRLYDKEDRGGTLVCYCATAKSSSWA